MLPRYAYDFSKIEPQDEYEAKKRVVASLARHYEAEDAAKYYNAEIIPVNVDAAIQSIDKIQLNSKALSAAIHVQSLGRGRANELTFLDTSSYPDYVKTLEKMPLEVDTLVRELNKIFKDITYLQMSDLRRLIEAFDRMYADYEGVLNMHTNFNEKGAAEKRVTINKDGKGKPDVERLRDSWMILFNKMNEAYDAIDRIVTNYNERRDTLFSRQEITGGAYRGYSLSDPSTYATGEFI